MWAVICFRFATEIQKGYQFVQKRLARQQCVLYFLYMGRRYIFIIFSNSWVILSNYTRETHFNYFLTIKNKLSKLAKKHKS